MPSSELPPQASPTPPPGPHQPLCICHQSALLPLDEALFGGDWQAAHVRRGGGDAHCCRQGFMGYTVTHTSSIPAPAWPPAPEGSELRITWPGPALPHPHPTHCLLIVSIQKESTAGRNNSEAPTKHNETGATQGHHMPWRIDPLQSFAIGARTSHMLQLGWVRPRERK